MQILKTNCWLLEHTKIAEMFSINYSLILTRRKKTYTLNMLHNCKTLAGCAWIILSIPYALKERIGENESFIPTLTFTGFSKHD